jgi:hypothetical protein
MSPSHKKTVAGATNINENRYARGTPWNVLSTIVAHSNVYYFFFFFRSSSAFLRVSSLAFIAS